MRGGRPLPLSHRILGRIGEQWMASPYRERYGRSIRTYHDLNSDGPGNIHRAGERRILGNDLCNNFSNSLR
jgi:hypothetical protein